MPHTLTLPDAMPAIEHPTLLVVSDAHHCRLIDVGGHSLMEKETVVSREVQHTDRQGTKPGRGGTPIGVGDANPGEEHRLKEFANTLVTHIESAVRSQKIHDLYIAAPSKFLSVLKHHLPAELTKLLRTTLDGNFMKESTVAVLIRFRPDL